VFLPYSPHAAGGHDDERSQSLHGSLPALPHGSHQIQARTKPESHSSPRVYYERSH
jgi:hypothetical protein